MDAEGKEPTATTEELSTPCLKPLKRKACSVKARANFIKSAIEFTDQTARDI